MISERVVYRRHLFTCDNCGRTENILRSSEDPRDDLPWINGWIRLPLVSFAMDEQHACSRRCADAMTAAALDGLERLA